MPLATIPNSFLYLINTKNSWTWSDVFSTCNRGHQQTETHIDFT